MLSSVIHRIGGKENIQKKLISNLNWIEKSFDINQNKGSVAYITSWGSTGHVYPETTGYLIPTLLHASRLLKKDRYKNLASKQISFLKSIQNSEGSFFQSIDKKTPVVFDTAQILIGLIQYHNTNGELKKEIETTYNWLLSQLSNEGAFVKYNYKENYNPSYYSRVFWPMLQAGQILSKTVPQKIKKGLQNIVEMQNPNASFNQWSFDGNEEAFTHTIVYTLRGLWESAQILIDKTIESSCIRTLNTLVDLIKVKNGFAGSYDTKWQGDFSYVCSAGNAQLSILCFQVYQKTKDTRYLSIIPELLKPLFEAQKTEFVNAGGVPSSVPVYGKYQRFRYTNWTQKFFADALMCLISK